MLVDDDEGADGAAAVVVGDEAELLAVDAEHRLNIVHDGVGLWLLLELRLVPVL